MSANYTPSPVVHSVHFYEEEDALIQRLQSVLSSSLECGNSCLVVATAAHRAKLVPALKKRGIDVVQKQREGLLIMLDAQEMLAHFMTNGLPEKQRFLRSVGDTVMAARQQARNAARGLTVFGEMVAVLWQQGNRQAALQLESLWNERLNDETFHLHCAYPRSLFSARDRAHMTEICELHSHIVGAAPVAA